MAQAARRISYDPYRNYGYAYDGSAARVLEEDESVQSRPHVRPRNGELARPKVEVRPAGKVSLFAVAGFAAVAVMAVLLLMGHVRLSAISDDMVDLNSQMTKLQSEEATLRARYELAYDLGAIEKTVTSDGSMNRPQPGQIVYVSLAEPDNVVTYARQESADGLLGALMGG